LDRKGESYPGFGASVTKDKNKVNPNTRLLNRQTGPLPGVPTQEASIGLQEKALNEGFTGEYSEDKYDGYIPSVSDARKYNINRLNDDNRAKLGRVISGIYGYSIKELETPQNKGGKFKSNKERDAILDGAFNFINTYSSDATLANDEYVKYDADEQKIATIELFGLDNLESVTKGEIPFTYLGGARKIYDMKDMENVQPADFEELLRESASGHYKVPIRVVGETNELSSFPELSGDRNFMFTQIVKVGEKTFAVAGTPNDYTKNDITKHNIYKAAKASGERIPIEDDLNGTVQAVPVAIDKSGRPINNLNYEVETPYLQRSRILIARSLNVDVNSPKVDEYIQKREFLKDLFDDNRIDASNELELMYKLDNLTTKF